MIDVSAGLIKTDGQPCSGTAFCIAEKSNAVVAFHKIRNNIPVFLQYNFNIFLMKKDTVHIIIYL